MRFVAPLIIGGVISAWVVGAMLWSLALSQDYNVDYDEAIPKGITIMAGLTVVFVIAINSGKPSGLYVTLAVLAFGLPAALLAIGWLRRS